VAETAFLFSPGHVGDGQVLELMDSYGYIRDYHVEKYRRDVKEIQHVVSLGPAKAMGRR
jgi:hypothetical protein